MSHAMKAEAPGALPRFTPLHPLFAVRCDGLDLRHPLTRAQAEAVEAAMDRYAVMVFPAQQIDDDLQLAFGRNFGEVEAVPSLVDQSRRRLPEYRRQRQMCIRDSMGSGRLSLYLSAHLGAIHGMPRPEAMALVRELTEFATQRQFVFAHEWQPGDMVMWDNRCTMHRARPFADKKHPRDMRRVTLADVGPTLEQPA